MAIQSLQAQIPITDTNGKATQYFLRFLRENGIGIVVADETAEEAIAGLTAKVDKTTQVIAANGLAGGGNLDTDVTVGLAQVVRQQSGTSYTAVLADSNVYIQFTSGSPVTFTVPPHADVPFPIGALLNFEQEGAGQVTIAPGAGVTINSRDSALLTVARYSVAQVKKVATNTWTAVGDLTV
jgi:hypothetical protein